MPFLTCNNVSISSSRDVKSWKFRVVDDDVAVPDVNTLCKPNWRGKMYNINLKVFQCSRLISTPGGGPSPIQRLSIYSRELNIKYINKKRDRRIRERLGQRTGIPQS